MVGACRGCLVAGTCTGCQGVVMCRGCLVGAMYKGCLAVGMCTGCRAVALSRGGLVAGRCTGCQVGDKGSCPAAERSSKANGPHRRHQSVVADWLHQMVEGRLHQVVEGVVHPG